MTAQESPPPLVGSISKPSQSDMLKRKVFLAVQWQVACSNRLDNCTVSQQADHPTRPLSRWQNEKLVWLARSAACHPEQQLLRPTLNTKCSSIATALPGYVPSVLRGDRSKKHDPLKWAMACRTTSKWIMQCGTSVIQWSQQYCSKSTQASSVPHQYETG